MTILKKVKDNLIPLSLILTVPLFNLGYNLTNNSGGRIHNLTGSLDNAIPFLKLFILPYMTWYAFLLLSLAYLCFNYKEVFYKTILSIDIGLIICYLIYFFFQTTVPRPAVVGQDFFSLLVIFLYRSDPPLNCLPSIHVLTTFLVMRAIFITPARRTTKGRAIVIYGALIIVSTLFVKQHIVVDLLVAIILGTVLYRSVDFLLRGKVVERKSRAYPLSVQKGKSLNS